MVIIEMGTHINGPSPHLLYYSKCEFCKEPISKETYDLWKGLCFDCAFREQWR